MESRTICSRVVSTLPGMPIIRMYLSDGSHHLLCQQMVLPQLGGYDIFVTRYNTNTDTYLDSGKCGYAFQLAL